MAHQASPADSNHVGHAIHVGRFSLDPLLHLIDAATASLQRLRHRIEAPADEEAERGGNRAAHDAHDEPAPAAAIPKKSGLPRVAVALLALSCAAGLGTAVSYKLLSQSLRTSGVVAETLRDEIQELEKDGVRLQNEKSKYQKQVYEQEKEIRALQHEVESARGEAEDLRKQSTAKSVRGDSLVQASPGSTAAAAPGSAAATSKPASRKTGACTTGTANVAADLARCVEEFNRK